MSEQSALASWLAAAGLKQIEAAKELGVSGPTLSDWKAGNRRPSLANAIKIELRSNGAVPVESFGYSSEEIAGVSRLLARRRAMAKSSARGGEGGAA